MKLSLRDNTKRADKIIHLNVDDQSDNVVALKKNPGNYRSSKHMAIAGPLTVVNSSKPVKKAVWDLFSQREIDFNYVPQVSGIWLKFIVVSLFISHRGGYPNNKTTICHAKLQLVSTSYSSSEWFYIARVHCH